MAERERRALAADSPEPEPELGLSERRALAGDADELGIAELRARADAAAHWEALVAQAEVAIMSVDLEGNVTGWNPAAEQMFGASAAEVLGRPAHFTTPLGGEAETAELFERIRRGETVRIESPRLTADGRELIVARTISPIRDARGRLVGASTVARDVTDRNALEAELRVTEERWRAIFDSELLGVVVRDSELRVLECNAHYAEVMGSTPQELVGTRLSDLLAPDDAALFTAEYAARAAGEAPQTDIETTVTLRDGRRLDMRLGIIPVQRGDGGARYQVGLMQDVTEQRRLERELAQARRLDSIGRLAGGIAHELNNKLAVIMGFTDRVSNRLVNGDRSKTELAEVHRAAEQATELVMDLLAFGRRRSLDRENLVLTETVARLRRVLALALGSDVELVIEDHSGRAEVNADRAQLEQVLVSLALNACDAMPTGGRLTIRTTKRRRDGEPYVCVAVTDTGVGMSEEVRARAFEPFFTTKEFGEAAGLGLSSALGFIEQSGGTIKIESAPGAGTTVSIELPEAQREQPPAGGAQPHTDGTVSVLVVEDDDQVRALVGVLLADAGHRFAGAADGAQALEHLRRQAVDVLLVDLVLPDTRGEELARRARAIRPELAVVYTSGYAGEATLGQAAPPGDGFIAKPFSGVELERALEAALTSRSKETR